MLTDTQIAREFERLLGAIEAPGVPLDAIARRARQAHQTAANGWTGPKRYVAAAALGVVFAAVALPKIAPSLAQSLEAQTRALLHWTPPPPAPQHVWSAMRPESSTLAAAQGRVAFRIIAPAGLPADVVATSVSIARAGAYSTTTRSWSAGDATVTFSYRRADGRSFRLMAERFDSSAPPPSKYIFNSDVRDARGLPVRYDIFTWRNGDQTMSAVAGDGISSAEIQRIAGAMHGIPIPGVWPPRHTAIEKEYRIP
ncbi:MAG: hypothetical protein JO078_11350 [Candidatus Eremiobacteraeota bacterium]|nr:hypothetical protein [Candidatus Eremiobacteraeota bacterium]